jgi:asparagine synthase (glutamine-hydrolysing)
MSGFCGELSLKSRSSETENLEAMDRAIAPWGPDAQGYWQEGAIALGSRLLRITPEDAFDLQPLVEADLALVGRIRLDDRPTLGRTLGIDRADLNRLPDSQLLLRAWRHWGEDCVAYLYGDWTCAIWDRQRQSLWLGRDAAGNSGLYYWYDAYRLVFSNSFKALLAHPVVPQQPNAYQIARQLTVVIDPTQDSATAYADIYRLPVGRAMRCYRSQIEQPYTWWQPDLLPELDWTDDRDYYDAFKDLYAAAVTDRLRNAKGSIGLMFSSGLDSGSVAALAAPRLSDRLRAYISVPHFPPDGAPSRRLGDETALARSTAEHIGNIDFIPVSSQGSSVIAAIEALLEIHDRPGHAAVNYYWISDILSMAKEQGIRVMLTGQGGNATVSWSGIGNLCPTLLQGDWGTLLAAFRHSNVGAWLTLKRQILKPMLEPSLDALQRLKMLGKDPWDDRSAINPKFATQIDLYGRMQAAGQDLFFGGIYNPRDPRLARFRLGRLGAVGELWMENGAAYQLDVRDPTRDRRLIEFCWRVPDAVFWANGVQRGLIRQGMSAALPAAVLYSQRKGLQAADVGYRVWAEREAISAMLDRLETHSLVKEWLDVPKMRTVLTALAGGVTPARTQQVAAILLRGLGVGLFLTRF